jgi:hypothetical protein
MTGTNEQTNTSQPLDQAGWLTRHVVREACRAELRARCRPARKPSRLTAATVSVVAVTCIAATGPAVPEAAAAASPAARAGASEEDARTAGLLLWLRQPPLQAAPASTMPARPGSAAFWANPAVKDPYGRLPAPRLANSAGHGGQTRTASTPASRAAANVPLRFAVPQRSAGTAKQTVRQAPAPKAAPKASPYLIYDSVVPAAVPAGQDVATYADGPYAASPATVAGRGRVLWIDVNGTDLRADALDVEPGDATPAGAAAWVAAKLTRYPHSTAIIYSDRSWWPAIKADIGALPQRIRSRVQYWIADPTGHPHILPGSSATQWYWGPHYDISTAEPGFWR